MFGMRLILILAVMGGIIAYIADKLGSKIGKKKLTIMGLRPHKTSVLLTVLSGVVIAGCTVGVLAVSSQSARTALFGMEKLQKEMSVLNEEKTKVAEELKGALEEVKLKNGQIAKLDVEIKESQAAKAAAEANLNQAQDSLRAAEGDLEQAKDQYNLAQASLVTAKGEVASLTEARDRLNVEIKNLQQDTVLLEKGLNNMKEGQVLYRSGEVVFAGVLKGRQDEAQNKDQVQWLIRSANAAVLDRVGLEGQKGLEPVWIIKDEYGRLLESLNGSKNDLIVRIRAAANTVVGEPVICRLEIKDNKLIFDDGALIYRKIIDMDNQKQSTDATFMEFLSEVNKLSVETGVLQDPVTGKVGNMDVATMVELVKKMQKLGGKLLVSAYASGNIYSAGPVHLKVDVEKVIDSAVRGIN